jgi:polysaccharide export outer membrane protein
MAGDITQFGDRTSVRIIRSEKGHAADFTIDLTQAASLTPAAYYLHPDDVLYVAPVRRRALQNTSNTILLFTSILTTAAVLITAMVAVNK